MLVLILDVTMKSIYSQHKIANSKQNWKIMCFCYHIQGDSPNLIIENLWRTKKAKDYPLRNH